MAKHEPHHLCLSVCTAQHPPPTSVYREKREETVSAAKNRSMEDTGTTFYQVTLEASYFTQIPPLLSFHSGPTL